MEYLIHKPVIIPNKSKIHHFCCYEQVTKQSLSLQITKLKISDSRTTLKHTVQISVEERAYTVNMQSLLPEIWAIIQKNMQEIDKA
jgi:hypothetical protein